MDKEQIIKELSVKCLSRYNLGDEIDLVQGYTDAISDLKEIFSLNDVELASINKHEIISVCGNFINLSDIRSISKLHVNEAVGVYSANLAVYFTIDIRDSPNAIKINHIEVLSIEEYVKGKEKCIKSVGDIRKNVIELWTKNKPNIPTFNL